MAGLVERVAVLVIRVLLLVTLTFAIVSVFTMVTRLMLGTRSQELVHLGIHLFNTTREL